MGRPGVLQSMGYQRVRHDLASIFHIRSRSQVSGCRMWTPYLLPQPDLNPLQSPHQSEQRTLASPGLHPLGSHLAPGVGASVHHPISTSSFPAQPVLWSPSPL